ncbi:MAG: pyridoxamine 5'-phosphate oxidase [Chitinophagales bacterium]|nr:pyridoxamine 5'-phosphate oxidase [Chitinophagales bacterium]
MALEKNLHHHRKSYERHELTEEQVATDPFIQFNEWMEAALESDVYEPNAMVLSTATTDGKPSARVVLLKSYSKNGLVFFTNYSSRKGKEIAENPHASLLFFWDKLERQVRIEGILKKVSEEESENYFQSRPFESRLSAIVSPQSTVVPGREYLESELEKIKNNTYTPRPSNWGGYILQPVCFEFWQGRANRLHDRLVFEWTNGNWQLKRLAP